MRMRFIALPAMLSLAGSALAQPIETITLSIEWEKPTISFGETNKASVIATISPEIGTMVVWNTLPGNGTKSGELLGFASSIFDILGISNATNGTLEWKVNPEFNIANEPGNLGPDGGIQGVHTGQWIGNPNPNGGNTNQAVALLTMEWTESAGGAPYSVEFGTKMKTAKVYLDVGLPGYVGENCVKIDGESGFLVVPAPGIVAVLSSLTGALAFRRHRPTSLRAV